MKDFWKKYWRPAVMTVAIIMVPLAAYASLPKHWSAGNVLRASDPNANFDHLEQALRGGTHTAITNDDIHGNAGIVSTKLAAGLMIPKAMIAVGTAEDENPQCTAATCPVMLSSGFSGCARNSTGFYTCTISPARANTTYVPFVQAWYPSNVLCIAEPDNADHSSLTAIEVNCRAVATGFAATDAAFTLFVFDDNP